MPKYQKKPVVVEAFRVRAPDGGLPPPWLMAAIVEGTVIVDPAGGVEVRTLEGTMRGDIGDWIIQGVKGEIYPCKPDIFEATYTAV